MTALSPYEAHQRQRWLRPDWRRWCRPGAETLREEARERAEKARRLTVEREAHAEWLRDLEVVRDEQARLRWMLADLRVDIDRARYLARKYNPDQPRVPDGGQWTSGEGGGGDEDSLEIGAAKKQGHHYVPRGIFDKLPFKPETRKVFEDATTGRLRDERSNKYDFEHRAYNEAAREHLDSFLMRNSATIENMTPRQGEEFLKEVLGSTDPRIRNYNMKTFLREILRSGPFRRGRE